jgi:hypothetical protein
LYVFMPGPVLNPQSMQFQLWGIPESVMSILMGDLALRCLARLVESVFIVVVLRCLVIW